MTILETPRFTRPAPQSASSGHFLLATDLDGTLLAGTPAARRRVRELFAAAPRNAKLAFVTGRGLESILPLLSDSTIPTPDFIIADVGATIVHGDDLRPVDNLQQDIADRWPGSQAVLKALAGFPGLTRQGVPQERRHTLVAEADEHGFRFDVRLQGDDETVFLAFPRDEA